MSSMPIRSTSQTLSPGPSLGWIPSLQDQIVITDLRDRPDLTRSAKEIWAFLVRAFRSFRGNLYCSERYIAQELGYSVRTIRRAFRQLEAAELLRLTPRFRRPKPGARHGGSGPSTWQFHPRWKPYRPPSAAPSDESEMTGAGRTVCPPPDPSESQAVCDGNAAISKPIQILALQEVNQPERVPIPSGPSSSEEPAPVVANVLNSPRNNVSGHPEFLSSTASTQSEISPDPSPKGLTVPEALSKTTVPVEEEISPDGPALEIQVICRVTELTGLTQRRAAQVVRRFGSLAVGRVLDWIATAPAGKILFPKAWFQAALRDRFEVPTWVQETEARKRQRAARVQVADEESRDRARKAAEVRDRVAATVSQWATLEPLLAGGVGQALADRVQERILERLPNATLRERWAAPGSPIWQAVWLEVWAEAGNPTG